MTWPKVIAAGVGGFALTVLAGCGPTPARELPPAAPAATSDAPASPTPTTPAAAPPPPVVVTTAAPPPPPPAPPVKTSSKPPPAPATDPRYSTCKEAKAHGYGPYYKGIDPEYYWYRDADSDGIVCE